MEVTEPGGRVTVYGYDAVGRRTYQRDPEGNEVRYEYDPLGRLVRERFGDGFWIAYEYDAAGNLLSRSDASGATIRYQYDALDRVTRIDYPDGTWVEYTYDPVGNRLTETGPEGTTRYTYTPDNRVATVTHPDGSTTEYIYDPAGNIDKVIQDGREMDYSYDRNNRVTEITDRLGYRYRYEYDRDGYVTAIHLPNGLTTHIEYDADHRIVRQWTEGPAGTVSEGRYEYEARGLRSALEEDGRRYAFGYDGRGQMTEVVTPAGDIIRYYYDGAGNLVKREAVIAGARVDRGETISVDDLMAAVLFRLKGEDPEAVAAALAEKGGRGKPDHAGSGKDQDHGPPDDKGKPKDNSKPEDKGQPDGKGRPEDRGKGQGGGQGGGEGSQGAGRSEVCTAGLPAGADLMEYRAARPAVPPVAVMAAMAAPGKGGGDGKGGTKGGGNGGGNSGGSGGGSGSGKGGDNGGGPGGKGGGAGSCPPGHGPEHGHGQGHGVGQGDGHGQGRGPAAGPGDGESRGGRPGLRGIANALTRGQGKKIGLYRKWQEELGLTAPTGLTANLLSVIDNIVNGEYYLPPGDKEEFFALVREVGAGYTVVGTTYTYNDENQLVERHNLVRDEVHRYEYDERGNMVSNGRVRFRWDAENRLVEVVFPDGEGVWYRYDALGRRVSKTTFNAQRRGLHTTYYEYEGNTWKVLRERNQSGEVVAEYTYDLDGRPLTITYGGETYWYIYNAHGDVVALTDATGAVKARYEYDEWGRVQAMYDEYGRVREGYGTIGDIGTGAPRPPIGSHPAAPESGQQAKPGKGKGRGQAGAEESAGRLSLTPEDLRAFGSEEGELAVQGVIGEPTDLVKANPYRYAGYRYDRETQYYYLRARYYDGRLGRFLSPDTWPGDVRQPLTLNRYIYVVNNPVNYVDPSGRSLCTPRTPSGCHNPWGMTPEELVPNPDPLQLPVLKYGDRGRPVWILQMLLMMRGQRLEQWGADGIFGSETLGAVKAFQRASGLTATGEVDARTWAALLGQRTIIPVPQVGGGFDRSARGETGYNTSNLMPGSGSGSTPTPVPETGGLKPASPGDGQTIQLGVPRLSQADPRWRDVPMNKARDTYWEDTGCLGTSIAMVAAYFNPILTVDRSLMERIRQEAMNRAADLEWARADAFLDKHGADLQYQNTAGWTWDDVLPFLLDNLQKRNPVIVGVVNKVGSKTHMHWVVVDGYTGNGESLELSDFLIKDPGYDHTTLEDLLSHKNYRGGRPAGLAVISKKKRKH